MQSFYFYMVLSSVIDLSCMLKSRTLGIHALFSNSAAFNMETANSYTLLISDVEQVQLFEQCLFMFTHLLKRLDLSWDGANRASAVIVIYMG